MKMTNDVSFVLVHGGWHSKDMWDKVVPLLSAAGFKTHTLDLPGAGEYALEPASRRAVPFDPAAFATEPSLNASVTQNERTEAVTDLVRKAAGHGGKIVLVGHSLGGITISPVAETVPELLHAAVYLSAFLIPPTFLPIAMMQNASMAASISPSLFLADSKQVGALRLNPTSLDAGYRARLKTAFYTDVDDKLLMSFVDKLHCDEPASVFTVPSTVTPQRFGSVKRYYIRCAGDKAITPEAQNFMIEAMDSAMPNQTITYDLNTSHSPFLSQPQLLADVLLKIAR